MSDPAVTVPHDEVLRTVLGGREPYRWQRRLFEMFLDGAVPEALDVPTGLGKTTVMGLWLAARAVGASMPRRLVYVVDRRTVVDQATTEAEAFVTRLAPGEAGNPLVESIRRGLGLADSQRMPVSTLRGQFADNRDPYDESTSLPSSSFGPYPYNTDHCLPRPVRYQEGGRRTTVPSHRSASLKNHRGWDRSVGSPIVSHRPPPLLPLDRAGGL